MLDKCADLPRNDDLSQVYATRLLTMWIIVPFILLVCPVAAIYEDQAGQHDWHRPHVGVAAHLHITHKRHTYIVSDDATLARITPDDGVLAWRRVQDAPGSPATLRTALVLPKEDGLLTVHTTSGALLRVWRDGGQLMWEAPLGQGAADVAVAVDEAKGASVVVALHDGQVTVRYTSCTQCMPLLMQVCRQARR